MENLSDLAVLVVDCQTTGASPAHGVVLELGWGVARADQAEIEQLQAHWLNVPAGHPIDFQVRRLTGFDESRVTHALDPEDAWRRLRRSTGFAARIPGAIHFARFELAFLRDWASRFEPETTFPLDAVCVHAIACRLYPDLPRRSLRALAGYLGHGLDPARRCLGHVEATAFIWRKLVSTLDERGIRTWAELGDWLAAPKPAGSPPRKRRYPLPSARYRALPDQPGVYRFIRSNGDVLYIGKAASLRKRVASHFTAGWSTTERALEMLTQVHDIQTTPTHSALEAALLENEAIKALHPPYNVQLVAGDPRIWFTNAAFDDSRPAPDEVHRFGPLPSTFSVHALGAIRALASGRSATPALAAQALGTSERWAPDERAFAAGFAIFSDRHALRGSPAEVSSAAVLAAKKLLLAAKLESPKAEADLDGDDATATAERWAWDDDRIVRHLERATALGHQLLQRARWLCLLHDSAVVFREPSSEASRLLLIHDGNIEPGRAFAPGDPLPAPVDNRPLRERGAGFDRSRYDRLRTLTTELKRLLRDGGAVEVRVGRGRWLRGNKLEALLLWV